MRKVALSLITSDGVRLMNSCINRVNLEREETAAGENDHLQLSCCYDLKRTPYPIYSCCHMETRFTVIAMETRFTAIAMDTQFIAVAMDTQFTAAASVGENNIRSYWLT